MRFFVLPIIWAATCLTTLHAENEAEPTLVAQLESFNLQLQDGTLIISAKGEVPTGGYTKPQLLVAAHTKKSSPEDGILDVFFMITPPPIDALVTQAITPVECTLKIRNYQKKMPWIQGVRLHTASGERLTKPVPES